MIMTPPHTMTKARRVPILVMSPRLESGTKSGEQADENHENEIAAPGSLELGWTSENSFGSSPSRDIE